MSQNQTIMKLQEMKQSKKGFTLVELLIVVAIIAILVAIAVPTFMGSVTKANQETDAANMRAAKSTASQTYLIDGTAGQGATYYFNASTGKCESDEAKAQAIEAYSSEKTGNIIKCVVDKDGTVTCTWVVAKTLAAVS